MASSPAYKFGPFELDLDRRLLTKNGAPVPVDAKAFETLRELVANHGHMLTCDELMRRVWRNTFVSSDSLRRCISTLRRVLDDRRKPHAYIRNVHGVGYEFIANIPREDNIPGPEGKVILRSMISGSRVMRSAESLAHESKLRTGVVEQILGLLRLSGFVELKREEFGLRWYVTDKGRGAGSLEMTPDNRG